MSKLSCTAVRGVGRIEVWEQHIQNRSVPGRLMNHQKLTRFQIAVIAVAIPFGICAVIWGPGVYSDLRWALDNSVSANAGRYINACHDGDYEKAERLIENCPELANYTFDSAVGQSLL